MIGREPPVLGRASGGCAAVALQRPADVRAGSARSRGPGVTGCRRRSTVPGATTADSSRAAELSQMMPDWVRVEPEVSFFPFPADRAGLARLLEERDPCPSGRAERPPLGAPVVGPRAAGLQPGPRRVVHPAVHYGERRPPSPSLRVRTCRAVPPRRPPVSRANGSALELPLPGRELGLRRWPPTAASPRSSESGLELDWTPFVRGFDWGLSRSRPRSR